MKINQNEIKKILQAAVLDWQKEKTIPVFDIPEISIDRPKNEKFGDYSTNIALMLAGKTEKNPMEIAELLRLNLGRFLRFNLRMEVVSPGYINFHLSKEYLQGLVGIINKEKNNFGNNGTGGGKKVLVEFISANPTGPIHLGNGRGGPLGDTLANVLEKSGYETEREFYVNDFGNQVEILGHSLLKDDEAQYRGDYIDELAVAAELLPDKSPIEIGNWAANEIIKKFIKPACEKLGIKFDNWFSERKLHGESKIDGIIDLLRKKRLIYEKDSAVWYKSTAFGDDKDRVIIKSDGKKTYISTDFAYHKNKIERGFGKLINIQGADHHKEAEIVKNFVENVLGEKNKLEIILIQMVRVIKDKKEMKMSKRKGVYFALDDLIEEVGKDAVRFIFLSYSPNTHINFDINLAKERSEKNPVYYAQYAHARIHSILAKAQSPKPKAQSFESLSLLVHPKELSLMKELNKFPELIEEIAQNYEVHKLPHYAVKLADKFHSFYGECRVIDENNPELSAARHALINAVRIVLAETLRLMGITAPEHM